MGCEIRSSSTEPSLRMFEMCCAYPSITVRSSVVDPTSPAIDHTALRRVHLQHVYLSSLLYLSLRNGCAP